MCCRLTKLHTGFRFRLIGSIQTTRPISVSKEMTAVSLRPDRTHKDRLSGHVISVAVGLLLNHFTALRYSLLSANQSRAGIHTTYFQKSQEVLRHLLLCSVLSQYKCTGIFSELLYRNRYTTCSPCAETYIYYRYIITRILLHTHTQRHGCDTFVLS